MLLALAMAAVAVALPDYPLPVAQILTDDRTQDGYGGHTFKVESDDGIVREEEGSQNDGQNLRGHWK